MKKTALSFLLSLAWSLGFSQYLAPTKIDSLKHELAIATSDTSRVLAMTELASTYQSYKPDSSFQYAQQALMLARKINYPKGEFEALFRMGFTLGIVGNYPRALEMQLKALRIAEKHNFLDGKADVFKGLGVIYRDAGDYSKAVVFHQRSRLLNDSLQNHEQSAGLRNVLAIDYLLMNKTDSAQYYAQLAYEATNRWKVEWLRSPNFLMMGSLQAKLENFPLALDYLKKSAHYGHVRQQYFDSPQAYLLIAKVYQQTNQPDSTFYYAQKALADAQKGNIYKEIVNASLFLSSLYEQKNALLALQYQQIALAAKDSLYNFGNLTAIQNQVAFDEEERQYEIETAQTAWRNQVWRYALLAGLGVVLLVSFILFRNNRQKQKANARLQAQNRELEIEASLERVRARAMSMFKSEELGATIFILFNQLKELNIPLELSWVSLVDAEGNKIENWMTRGEGIAKPAIIHASDFEVFKQNIEAWKHQQDAIARVPKETAKGIVSKFFHLELDLAGKADFFFVMNFWHRFGFIGLGTFEEIKEEERQVIKRFAKVFEQTYTRFLDLQKAEAQTREAQIEAALERVRARTMAMHNSVDVTSATETLFEELKKLGIDSLRCGIANIHHNRTFDVFGVTHLIGENTMSGFGFFGMDEHPIWQRMFESWKNKEEVFIAYIAGQEKEEYFNNINNHLNYLPQQIIQFPDSFFQAYNFEQGSVWVYSLLQHTEPEKEIMKRSASGFSLTFRRYQDLKKAEAQAREATIEAALEKVRGKAMAMQTSEDVVSATSVLFNELENLGIKTMRCGILLIDETQTMEVWTSLFTKDGQDTKIIGSSLDMNLHPLWHGIFISWKQKEAIYSYKLIGPDIKKYYAVIAKAYQPYSALAQTPDLPDHYCHVYFFEEGGLYTFSLDEHNEETRQVLNRFTAVFSLTFRRYQDLKQAEAQAREATIEAALERVRAKTMGMHSSEDVVEATAVVFNELHKLGIETLRCGILIIDESKTMEVWTATRAKDGHPAKIIGMLDMTLHPLLDGIFLAWKSKEESYEYHLRGQDRINYYQTLSSIPIYQSWSQFMSDPDHTLHVSFFEAGGLYVFHVNPLSDEHIGVMKRFTSVFSLTFRRYQDLKKAEAQLREAQIEAALERVRSRTMAMQRSDELLAVTSLIYNQLKSLGLQLWNCGIMRLLPDSYWAEIWMTRPDGQMTTESFRIPLDKVPVYKKLYDGWKKEEPYYMEAIRGNEVVEHSRSIAALNVIPFDKMRQEAGRSLPEQMIFHALNFKEGILGIVATDETGEIDLLKRFGSTFRQTYTRFLDLQKAEARAVEAARAASLDRVRGEIASMRTTDDLQRITPLVWRELTMLGVPFFRCGVFMMDEANELVHTYLSTPTGKSLAAMHLPYDAAETTRNAVEHWRKREVYTDFWDKQQFAAWVHSMTEQGHVKEEKTYQGGEEPPESLSLQFVPFTQGMLYVGSAEPLTADQISLIKTLADAFAVAYARYEDFTKLEEAKNRVEATLTELKATQSQLIQSEKLASLGELTAGIAHEIQNPLNFVNNFSELSVDLAKELNEELEKDSIDKGFVKELMGDLTSNQEKINHHGKRAAAIVTGMLQHARTSTGKKESTDLNALADEYLRLSYHGLRAKDSSFNANMVTDFDPAIGKVEVIPQDIGRVFLNIINNSFYAVAKRKEQEPEGFEPTVSVSSRLVPPLGGQGVGAVEFRIKDNGTGIPDGVKARIFQPFFTTKPTGQGTGLGLSLAYDIVVKGHGGALEVESAEGVGTEFVIQLPVKNNG